MALMLKQKLFSLLFFRLSFESADYAELYDLEHDYSYLRDLLVHYVDAFHYHV